MQIPPLIPTLARVDTATAFRRLVHATDRTLRGLARDLANGTIDTTIWYNTIIDELAEAHARAGFHGRQRAGDRAPFDQDDTRFGALAVQEEMTFLDAFRWDLLGDRYRKDDGTLDAGRIADRAAMYANRLHATANEALVLVADEVTHWRLGIADHCPDCLEMAAHSPYRPGALRIWPQSGKLACVTNCKCTVETESGLVGFRP